VTGDEIKAECEALGLQVRRIPTFSAMGWDATSPGIRVYWTTSLISEHLLGLPRVATKSGDTHARSILEIRYLVRKNYEN
jgi:hypothetical protein